MHFFVHGTPAPGGSKKYVGQSKAGRAILVDAGGKKTKTWRQDVVTAIVNCEAGDYKDYFFKSLSVVCTFHVLRPKGHFNAKGELKKSAPKYPTTRPDATKLWRSTEDALTGIIWKDDASIVSQLVSKVYGTVSGADIYIEEKE